MKIDDDPHGTKRSNTNRFAGPSEAVPPDSVAEAPSISVSSSAQYLEPVGEQDAIPISADLFRRHSINVVQVKGNSMIEDNLFDGDQVIVEKRGTLREGELVVAVIKNRAATRRRFHFHQGRITLESPNPSHKTMTFDEKDVVIQGVVVGILRQYTGWSSQDTTGRSVAMP